MKSETGFRFFSLYFLLVLILSGCAAAAKAGGADSLPARSTATAAAPAELDSSRSAGSQAGTGLQTFLGGPVALESPPARRSLPGVAAQADSPAETPTPAGETGLTPAATAAPRSAADWQQWPVLPGPVSDELREIYRQGLVRGNDPHAFSILGDCQSLPEVFMGIYDTNPAYARGLPPNLQETVRQFEGSFNRYSPTVKDGTTEGALLWGQWNDNEEGKCTPGEPPIDCELRVHRPAIVFIHVGTHWEARNEHYLSLVIEKILESKAVPVLVTKADNRELDGRVNHNLAVLAVEYDLPLWNFWASVQHLPENGMEPGSIKYLSQAGLEIHRRGALEALDAVWRDLQ